MLRFLETFYRHRLLLLSPVALVFALCVGWVVIQPPAYDSSVRLWTERQTLVQNNVDNPYLSPAQSQTNVLTELLNTKYFSLKVGKRSPLAARIKEDAQRGARDGPFARLGIGGSRQLSQQQLDDMVFQTVSSQTMVWPAGPEIVTLVFRAGSPELAALVAQAIADQFVEEVLATQRLQSDAAIDFYTSQLKQAQADVAASNKAVDDYLVSRPELRGTSAVPDARLSQLRRDADAAGQRLGEVQGKLDQSKLDRAALTQPVASGLRILDKAEVPTRPSSIRATVLQAGAVAVGLGLALLVTGVLVMTLVDNTVRRPEEVEPVLDLRPVGAVPRVR